MVRKLLGFKSVQGHLVAIDPGVIAALAEHPADARAVGSEMVEVPEHTMIRTLHGDVLTVLGHVGAQLIAGHHEAQKPQAAAPPPAE